MNSSHEKTELDLFAFQLAELLNSRKSLKKKITEALEQLARYFHYQRGFVYQTDGFHYYLLKETFGNEDKQMPRRFESSQMSAQHIKRARAGEKYVCWGGEEIPVKEKEILAFYKVRSLLIVPVWDTNGKSIGSVGLADYVGEEPLDDRSIQVLSTLLSMLAKEVVIREYEARGVRTRKTLESIMNHMGVDIYVNSYETHDMLYANESMAAPYGGYKNFEGKKCWQALYNDKTGECDFCPKHNIIDEQGRPTKVYSWDYQRPFDKSWFRVFSAAFDWIDGQLAQVITSVDITHQKNIEQQLIEAKEKAETLDRLKSQFLANMSHEIRTPLNAIVGFSELMTTTEDADERAVYGNIIKENNELLLQLISDILDLSRMEAGILTLEPEPIDVRKFVEEIVLSYSIKDTPVPVVLEAGGDFTIVSDRRRLMQVVTNFVNNAVKFTTEGQITVGYGPDPEGNGLKFFVRDTGMGIAPEKVDKVFDRFVKLNAFIQGTGLGLSICKSIIEQLYGTIGAESEVGKGSCFWFVHPLQEIEAPK